MTLVVIYQGGDILGSSPSNRQQSETQGQKSVQMFPGNKMILCDKNSKS